MIKLNGFGFLQGSSGSKYEGMIKNGKKHGSGI
jgi:hypothetical protein